MEQAMENECAECHTPLGDNGNCVNIDCCTAQKQATVGARRDTAKATAGFASEPRAFTSSGRVD